MEESTLKARTYLLAFASLALATAAPVDASNADLRVAGSITPGAACAMKLGNNNLIELGRITRDDLHPDPTQPTKLETQRIKMFINCGSAQRYALVASSASAPGGDEFDFGLVSGNGQVSAGSLRILFSGGTAHIEGKNGYYTTTLDQPDLENAAWGPSKLSTLPIPNGVHALGFVTTDGSRAVPPAIKDFDAYLLVEPTIRPVNELDLRDEIAFAGELGFEIRYF